MTTRTLSGGEAVVAALETLGVTTVFGIVSVHNVPTLDAIAKSDKIDFVSCRHEQGAVHAADSFARVTGQIGVALTSTGPGAANAMGGLFEAFYASSPVLMITGQVESDQYGRGQGSIHQAENQLTMMRTVTCRAEHIARHADIASTILSIGGDMISGRPRPGAVEIPITVQYQRGEVPELVAPVARTEAPVEAQIAAAAELIDKAERPLILSGGGVIIADASAQLTQLAELLDAPVFTTLEGRGAITEDHRLSMGPNMDLSAMDAPFAEADVVIAIGTRFQQNNNVVKWLEFEGDLIHIDADVTMIGRVHPTTVPVLGDASLSLDALLHALGERTNDPAWSAKNAELRDSVVASNRESIGADLEKIMDSMDRILPENAVVAKDATIAAYQWANRMLPVRRPRSTVRPASMAIGPGVPLGIGAAVGSKSPTVVIQGDGGFMLSVGELATIVQEDLPMVVCVFNDRGYGIIKVIQDLAVGGRHTGADLATPEFAPMAEAYGMNAAKVESAEEFDTVFAEAVESGKPWLIDIDLTKMEKMVISPQPKPDRS